MAVAISSKSGEAHVLGTNLRGELGLGDTKVRNKYTKLLELESKEVLKVAIGGKGFALAIGNLWHHQ